MSGSVGFFLGKRALSKDFKSGESKTQLSRALFGSLYSQKSSPTKASKGPDIEEIKKAAELIGKLNRKSEHLNKLMRQHIDGENYADIFDNSMPEDNLHMDIDPDDNKIRLRYGVSPAYRKPKKKAKVIPKPLKELLTPPKKVEEKPNIHIEDEQKEEPKEEDAPENRDKEEEALYKSFNQILQISGAQAEKNKKRAVRLNDYVHYQKERGGLYTKLKPIDDFVYTATQAIKFTRDQSISLTNSLVVYMPELQNQSPQTTKNANFRGGTPYKRESRASSGDSKSVKFIRKCNSVSSGIHSSTQDLKQNEGAGTNAKFKSIYNDCVFAHKSIGVIEKKLERKRNRLDKAIEKIGHQLGNIKNINFLPGNMIVNDI